METKSKYYPTIGLEVHAELKTKTKMFCSCQNDPFNAKPNVNICPICMAHPGTLPVPNKAAIEHVVRIGLAVGGTIANFTEFDRKNYFYPDIPKGYQISQYKHPIVAGGEIAGFPLTRIHIEEDTATSKHKEDKSIVDYNRAGVPLMELVTEPTLHSKEDALYFTKELQLLLRYLGASNADMEKGEMRIEVNISLSKDKDKLGTKVEVKNINSHGAAARAIDYEIQRMTKLLDEGREEEITQETRGWDDIKQKSFSLRKKENSDDYRYFPDPDLPKMYLHEIFDINELKQGLPELPNEKRTRYRNSYGIKDEDIESYIQDLKLSTLFENVSLNLKEKDAIKLASNYLTSDLIGLLKKKDAPDRKTIFLNINPDRFAKLIQMNMDNTLNSRATKDILLIMCKTGEDPEVIAKKNNLIQNNDPKYLENIAQKIITENPDQAKEYKNGKESLLKYFVGQAMKETKGSANPNTLETIFKELLDN